MSTDSWIGIVVAALGLWLFIDKLVVARRRHFSKQRLVSESILQIGAVCVGAYLIVAGVTGHSGPVTWISVAYTISLIVVLLRWLARPIAWKEGDLPIILITSVPSKAIYLLSATCLGMGVYGGQQFMSGLDELGAITLPDAVLENPASRDLSMGINAIDSVITKSGERYLVATDVSFSLGTMASSEEIEAWESLLDSLRLEVVRDRGLVSQYRSMDYLLIAPMCNAADSLLAVEDLAWKTALRALRKGEDQLEFQSVMQLSAHSHDRAAALIALRAATDVVRQDLNSHQREAEAAMLRTADRIHGIRDRLLRYSNVTLVSIGAAIALLLIATARYKYEHEVALRAQDSEN